MVLSPANRFRLSRYARIARCAPLDVRDLVLGRRDPLLPPRRHTLVGDGDFVGVGREHVGMFIDLGGLRPSDAVLDIGCGIGRMAIPLTSFLAGDAHYTGFDVDARMVRWCQRHISPRHPNFVFHRADIANDQYNPAGDLPAREYAFPCEDDSIDFAFATSVFTHLLPAASRRYIAETARVLRCGGRCFFTFFLLTPDTLARMEAGAGDRRFDFDHGEHRSEHATRQEIAVAYPEAWVRGELDRHGLDVCEPIAPGLWSGASDAVGYQDIVVAERRDA